MSFQKPCPEWSEPTQWKDRAFLYRIRCKCAKHSVCKCVDSSVRSEHIAGRLQPIQKWYRHLSKSEPNSRKMEFNLFFETFPKSQKIMNWFSNIYSTSKCRQKASLGHRTIRLHRNFPRMLPHTDSSPTRETSEVSSLHVVVSMEHPRIPLHW